MKPLPPPKPKSKPALPALLPGDVTSPPKPLRIADIPNGTVIATMDMLTGDIQPVPGFELVPEFPTTMGECIDKLYTMRAARLTLEKQVEAAKSSEEAMKKHIVDTFGEDNLNGASGSIASASISPDIQPLVVDWEIFYAYIVENNAFDLLERRVGKLAFKARLDDGIEIPGTTHKDIVRLNVTKRGGGKRK